MGRPRRVECRVCNGHVDDVGPLSARGKCESCGIELVSDAIDAMFSGRGPVHDRWQSNYVKSMRRVVDKLESASSDATG